MGIENSDVNADDLARIREARPITYRFAARVLDDLDAAGDGLTVAQAVALMFSPLLRALSEIEERLPDSPVDES